MRFLIFLLVFLPSILSAQSEGIHWMSFAEAMAKRQTQPKKIFIDMYTDWCGWCKVWMPQHLPTPMWLNT